ncbi:MAG: hypothetical protein KAI43_05435 [Candidatus Aureabacteria bacterium]|nr:hypothetical protein [Candidatus Auribacterota bacterium]
MNFKNCIVVILFLSVFFSTQLLAEDDRQAPTHVKMKNTGKPLPSHEKDERDQSLENNKNESSIINKSNVSIKPSAVITLEMKDIAIVEVLKILSKKGKINIIIGQNVKGRITLFLKDVSVWDALKNVFEIANLAYVKRGSVFQIMTGRDYLQLYGRAFFDNREMKIIPVHHADVNDVLGGVKGFVSKIGSINIDARTNSLIVIDSTDTIREIERAVFQIDRPLMTEIFSLRYLSITQAEEIVKNIITKKGKYQIDAATNKIIITDISGRIETIRKIIQEYDVETSLITRIYRLNYASYEKLEPKIKELVTPNIGKVSSDERTNTIVVMDIPSNIEKIDQVINAYDAKTLEVLIEAKIVQVQLSDDFKYGINWQHVVNNWQNSDLNVKFLSGFDVVSSSASSLISSTTDDSTDETAPETETTETPFSDTVASLGGGRMIATGQINHRDFDSVLDILRQVGNAKVLSSPRIMVIDGETAKIQVAKREAYVTNTIITNTGQPSETAENVNFVDVGVILTVTPQINDEGFILMKIKPEVSVVDSVKTTSTGNTVPIVATQEAESSILVKDGVTIVMGGLIQERTLKTTSKIPFLGDIPILGIPFRKLIKEVDKTELVLFLTPTIVQGDRNFYDDDSVIVGDDVKEIFEQATPEFYTNPIKKTKRFLKDEFLAE